VGRIQKNDTDPDTLHFLVPVRYTRHFFIRILSFQLFEHCLAPDTHGDGTGCDNMTAVIVKFKNGFQTVKDVVQSPAAEDSAGSSAAGSSTAGSSAAGSSGGKRAAAEQPDEESGSAGKKPKLEGQLTDSS
jgi:protein phosphatase 1G